MHRPANMHPDAEQLGTEREATRHLTLDLVSLLTEQELRTAYHPDFSPVGWHLGHIAAFEAFWVLQHAHGEPPISASYNELFDPRQVAKPNRTQLPTTAELLDYAALVRQRTTEHLTRDGDLFFHSFVLSHEQQHAETIATILRMRPRERRQSENRSEVRAGVSPAQGIRGGRGARPHWKTSGESSAHGALRIPASHAEIGENDRFVGYDNERPAHVVELAAYEIDSHPVTNAEWLAFMDEGGYRRRELWTDAGWAWLASEQVEHPFHWLPSGSEYLLRTLSGDIALPLDCPVEGISAHEADAYARSVEKRLPTEPEWEHAAREHPTPEPRLGIRCGGVCADGGFIGNVWEWTSSIFDGYPGFEPYPYAGYSQAYFDGQHRVLRGGSWATQTRIARPSFRNWYPPHWRAMPVGVRCAQ